MLYPKLVDPAVGAISQTARVQPLMQLFSTAKSSQHRSLQISIRQRARIGRQLATALLQYNSTPWLINSLSSQHLLVDCSDPNGGNEDDSYLDVSVRSSHDDRLNRLANGPTEHTISSQQTFDLGVMLLELALQKPLHELKRMRDSVPNSDTATDYRTADRVQRRIARQAGSQFAMVVGRCLHW